MDGVEGLLHGLLDANGFNGIVGAVAPANLLDRRYRIFDGARVNEVCGAKLASPFQLLIEDIHRDDFGRADDGSSLDRVQSNATAAVYDNRRTRFDLRSIHDRTGTGHDAAAHQANDFQGRILA